MVRIARIARLAIAIAAPAIVWAGHLSAQEAPPPETPPDETLAVDLDKSLRMTTNVVVDGKGPFPFIVDTGAHRTVIARELAEQLALKKASTIKLHTMAGVRAVSSAMVPDLTVNSIQLKKIQAPTLDQRNMGAPGLLGLDAFQSRRVVVDFRAGTMTLAPSVKLKKVWNDKNDKWEGETIIVDARRRFGQLILTRATVGGGPVDVIVDTGLEVSIGNQALRRRLFTRDGPSHGRWENITLVSVTGDAVEVESTIVDHLRIANMDIKGLPLAFADAHPFEILDLMKQPALLLGMDVLRLFDQLSLDFQTKEVGFRWSNKATPVPPVGSATTAAHEEPDGLP